LLLLTNLTDQSSGIFIQGTIPIVQYFLLDLLREQFYSVYIKQVMSSAYSYSIFFDFIESYLPSGFLNINANDPIIQQLTRVMQENDQFITVADLAQIKFLYVSEGIRQLIGVEPARLNPSHFVEVTHPDDLSRFGLLRAQTFIVEKEVLETKTGSALVSFTIRLRNPAGVYFNCLCQAYFFFSPIPHSAVYLLQVISNVDRFEKKKHGFHHYKGKDLSHFRFPDNGLLRIGPDFSSREMEIIKLIESGLSSKQIADKLFISVHTVNTHRRNILDRCGKDNISNLIYELNEQGLL
jgi:DNA-binding CsgD family transcriptional regulator